VKNDACFNFLLDYFNLIFFCLLLTHGCIFVSQLGSPPAQRMSDGAGSSGQKRTNESEQGSVKKRGRPTNVEIARRNTEVVNNEL
jgi:hypothetical protein